MKTYLSFCRLVFSNHIERPANFGNPHLSSPTGTRCILSTFLLDVVDSLHAFGILDWEEAEAGYNTFRMSDEELGM